MNEDLLISLVSTQFAALLTGVVSSVLVVFYFERRDKIKYRLSRAHIIERFGPILFGVLTIVRVTINEGPPESRQLRAVFNELKNILGRDNPMVLLRGLSGLPDSKHETIIRQLTNFQLLLTSLFSDALAHKTVEDKITASIAELQNWIDDVLSLYAVFPEVRINSTKYLELHTRWQSTMTNLVENTFTILDYIIDLRMDTEDDLRWGARSI